MTSSTEADSTMAETRRKALAVIKARRQQKKEFQQLEKNKTNDSKKRPTSSDSNSDSSNSPPQSSSSPQPSSSPTHLPTPVLTPSPLPLSLLVPTPPTTTTSASARRPKGTWRPSRNNYIINLDNPTIRLRYCQKRRALDETCFKIIKRRVDSSQTSKGDKARTMHNMRVFQRGVERWDMKIKVLWTEIELFGGC